MWKHLGHVLVESEIIANNGCNWSRHSLINVSRRKVRSETFLGSCSAEEHQPHWLRIRACRAEFREIIDIVKDGIRHRFIEPTILRACIQEQVAQAFIFDRP